MTGTKFSPKGDKLFSCDANGVVKSWDLRSSGEVNSFSCEKRSAYCLSVDRSGNMIGVGANDGLIYLFNDSTG